MTKKPGVVKLLITHWDMVFAILIVPVAGTITYFAYRGAPHITNEKIAATAYIWPKDCHPSLYDVGDSISRACTVSSVAIAKPENKGLLYNASYRGKTWFRVGNDAIYASCGFGYGDCMVYFNVRNKFVVVDSNRT